MNGLDNISNSELIYKFIDGETNNVEQTVLFDALSKDSELQAEFQNAMNVQNGLVFDKNVLAPSPELTNKIFSKAGFATSTTNIAKSNSKFSNIMLSTASLFVGVVLTTFVFWTSSNNQNYTSTEKLASIPLNEISMNYPNEVVHKSKKIPIVNHNDIFINNDNILKNNVQSISSSSIVNPNYVVPVSYDNSIVYDNFQTYDNNTDIEVNRLDYTIDIRGMTGLAYFPKREIFPQKSLPFNNISIGLLKKLNKHHSVGIFAGQESLQLYTFNQVGYDINFDLQPNLFWIAAAYKYTGNDIYGSISPYGEAMIGSSKFGPVGKISAGLTYNPQDFLSMSFGVELTGLMYKYYGKNRFTEKMSLVYGLGFHF